MDNILDHVVVQGHRYDIVSPTAFGDYIETIGSACINPDGYAKGSTFLARLGNEQFYYETTAAITQGSVISEGTNCKKTTVTGREAELASDIQTLGESVDSLNEALTNEVETRAKIGAHNMLFASLETAKATSNSGTWSNNVYTINGGTVTLNDDCSFIIDGTFSANSEFGLVNRFSGRPLKAGTYKVIGGKSNATITISTTRNNSYYILGTSGGAGATITVNSTDGNIGAAVTIKAGTYNNLKMGILISLPTDPSSEYTPYSKTNQQLTQETTGLIDNAFANGCVNLLNNTATSQVDSTGLTWSVTDGIVTANGTATGDNARLIVNNSLALKVGKRYKISGCPSVTGCALRVYNGSGTTIAEDTGSGAEFTVDVLPLTVRCIVTSGATVSSSTAIFKPMITLADMPNSDYVHYVPYAMTNRELTEKNNYASLITKAHASINYLPYSSVAIKSGNIVYINLVYTLQGAIPAYTKIFDVPSALQNSRNSDERIPMVVQGANQALYNPYNGGIYTSDNSWPDGSGTYHMACTFVI